jgi:hypothetical protein
MSARRNAFSKRGAKGKIMTDTLRLVAYLQKKIGDGAFFALLNPDNADAVQQFAQVLERKKSLPTEMTVGACKYDILNLLWDEYSATAPAIAKRAEEMNASLGHDDALNLLEHQQDIPAALRGKVTFIFPDWCRRENPEYTNCVHWNGDKWVPRTQVWGWLGDDNWLGEARLLRRK